MCHGCVTGQFFESLLELHAYISSHRLCFRQAPPRSRLIFVSNLGGYAAEYGIVFLWWSSCRMIVTYVAHVPVYLLEQFALARTMLLGRVGEWSSCRMLLL